MKRILTILATVMALHVHAQWSFTDDFEGYSSGQYVAQNSATWTTWSGTEGGAEDVIVNTSFAHSGTKSVYFSSTSSTGGPTDFVLPFPAQYNKGTYTFDCWMFVNTGKTAYFNFQQNTTIGAVWNSDFNFLADGTIDISNTQGLAATGTYPQNQWFHLTIDVNLNNSLWDVKVNGVTTVAFHNTSLAIASIDIYPVQNSQYYIDDVAVTYTPAASTPNNIAVSYITGASGLTGQQLNLKVLLRNLGTSTIANPEVKLYSLNTLLGAQTFTGLNIPAGDTQIVTLSTLFTVAASNDVGIEANISSSTLTDDDESDDTLIYHFDAITPAAGKMVVAEEGTGTWCQWCPRGAVFMEKLTVQYPGYFQGIAVHNADPMTVTDYDADIGFTGFPSAMVDRQSVIDPSAMEAPFITRVQVAPKAMLVNGAVWNATHDTLEVSITTTFAQAVASGNYKIACVLVEDSVTGTASGYNQVNAYAGGGQGPMGGFESLPNPVPASLMVYDHVARDISPSFAGLSGAFTIPAAIGYSKTHNFKFPFSSSWDEGKIHIVGLFIDNAGKIDNASSTTIDEAITNGFVGGSGVLGIEGEVETGSMVLYPNPAKDFTNLKVVLTETTDITVNIYSMDGKLIRSVVFGGVSGTQNMQIPTDGMAAGVYMTEVIAGKVRQVLKLNIQY